MVGVERSSAYAVVQQVCKTILSEETLTIKFPQSIDECTQAANQFKSISYGDAITNCVGVIDGYLLHTKQPRKKDLGNQRQYFSGHYKKFGINIQALCDYKSRFNYFALSGPGSMNNASAIEHCSLQRLVDNIPPGFIVIGDAAYTPSMRMAPIYYGVNREQPLYDNFNFFASQLRIRIEMAFGFMQMKWRILQTPRPISVNLKFYIMTISYLHNFVINYKETVNNEENLDESEEMLEQFLQSQPTTSTGDPIMYNEEGEVDAQIRPVRGHSVIREQMALRIRELGLTRPIQNIITNND